MTLYITIGCVIAALASHATAYIWGRKSRNGDIKAKEIRIDELIIAKANLRDENIKLQNQLKIATNKPSAGDMDNILQDGLL